LFDKNMNSIFHRNSKGFTLIELLVVISVIALLSSIVLASVNTSRKKAQVAKTLTEIRSLQNAIELYKLQNGTYPGASSNLLAYDLQNDASLTTALSGLVPTFISSIPHAPQFPNNPNYAIVYATAQSARCGFAPINQYVIGFYIADRDLNLPRLTFHDTSGTGDEYYDPMTDEYVVPSTTGPGTFCIAKQ
jgi:type II secretion system protein G